MNTVTMKKEKKILVVEDDKNLNRLISYNLAKNGFKAICVYDGLVAKERLSKEVFDAVILDIMLPGIDGFRICESIKEDPAAFKTFVVVLTARAEPLDKIYGNLVGADRYLTKPFSVAKLMEIIEELVELRDKEHFIKEVKPVK
ncbi:MAG TPA: response regulator [Patescibacteria group bacterium]|nr:response regulator [Patescibacteria group bacterium]